MANKKWLVAEAADMSYDYGRSLGSVLNELSEDGWLVFSVLPKAANGDGVPRFTVIACRESDE